MSTTGLPFARPLYVMAKPAGSYCNLACTYCYYLEKSNLYSGRASQQVMSDELLERYIREYITSQTTPEVLFTWHGGEALMRPISFYQKALELQKHYAKGRRIDNAIQTNGLLLNDTWCEFFKKNNFLVGISIDGPKEGHDTYRITTAGHPTHYRVLKAINLLKKHGVEYNALAVVNNINVKDPVGFYRFFKEIECHYIQFTPIVERLQPHADGTQLVSVREEGDLAPFSITPRQWGDFLIGLFDEWIKEDVGTYYIQLFDATLANWVGVTPGVCSMAQYCGHAGVMEHNGDVYSCDHFVFPEYKLGNIHSKTLVEMMYSERQQKFGRDKYDTLPRQCRECEYLFACWGECPKNRFVEDEYGNPGLNYLCSGYFRYFRHVAPYMDFMKTAYLAGRPPASVMTEFSAPNRSEPI